MVYFYRYIAYRPKYINIYRIFNNKRYGNME